MIEMLKRFVPLATKVTAVLCVACACPSLVEWMQSEGENYHILLQILMFPFMIIALILSIFVTFYLYIVYTFLPWLGDKNNLGSVEGDVAINHFWFWLVITVVLLVLRKPGRLQSIITHVVAMFSAKQQEYTEAIVNDLPIMDSEQEKERERVRKAKELENLLADNKIREKQLNDRQDPEA